MKAWTSEQGREDGDIRMPFGRQPLFAHMGPQHDFEPPFGFLNHKGQPKQLGLVWL